MRKPSVFNHLSLDCFVTHATGDMSWAHTGSDVTRGWWGLWQLCPVDALCLSR